MVGWSDILILSVVEGITEFLPISSTGHMIIAQNLLGIPDSPQLNAFLVIVQIGAIFAVVTAFWPTFFHWLKAWLSFFTKSPGTPESNAENLFSRKQSLLVCFAVIPVAVVGLIIHKYIKDLFSIKVVASALIAGALLIWFSEFLFRKKRAKERDMKTFSFFDALTIGLGQCLALWPGFSRSAATIISGRFRGFSQEKAAELSFLIGLPTLVLAAGYETLKEFHNLDALWWKYLAVGIIVSWIVAFIFVKAFLLFLRKYTLNVFALYRVCVGIFLLFYFK